MVLAARRSARGVSRVGEPDHSRPGVGSARDCRARDPDQGPLALDHLALLRERATACARLAAVELQDAPTS